MATQSDNFLTRKVWMIIGEGTVFLIILFLGFRQVQLSMAKQLRLSKQQNNFLLSVTHEFNSPLASIKLFLETFLKHNLEREKQQKFVHSALNETNRLNQMVDNILMINKLDAAADMLQVEKHNLSDFLKEYTQNKQSILSADATIKVDISENLESLFDKKSMEIVLNNLIENAVKYGSTKPVQIDLVLTKNSKKIVELEIADNGRGILEKEKVFEKFYREENELTRNTKGSGLGLYLCKQLLNMQKIDIRISDNQLCGTKMKLIFPAL